MLGRSAAGVASAGADAPVLPPLGVVVGSQPFSEGQLLSGTSASSETCSRTTGAFWVVDDGRGDCIRTYQSGFANGSNPRVIVFFHGDLVTGVRGKTPVTLVDRSYPRLTARGGNHCGEHAAVTAKDEILSRDRARGTSMQLTNLARSSTSSMDTVSHTMKHGRRRP